jgi:serine/threonine protein kinase
MGEVYEAFDRQLQGRVALKSVASTACDSQRAVRDLKAEVYLARRVTHPNVCRIYDLGTHELPNGSILHFLTMEFVEGETLGRRIRKHGALPLPEAHRLARALLEGLSAAHGAGILHRDFKSDNVILREETSGVPTPVILDFGLARSLDERSRRSNHAFVGTLTYMAPEQVEGSRLSRATDIYAFGVVWFEMLTGKLPFRGSPQMSALERLRKTPLPPSQINSSVPTLLDPVVLRCLRRSPEERFQSASEVLAALPTLPTGPSTRSSWHRTWLRAALLGASLGLLVAWVASRSSVRDSSARVVPNTNAALPAVPLPIPETRPSEAPPTASAPTSPPSATVTLPLSARSARRASANRAPVVPAPTASASTLRPLAASPSAPIERGKAWPFEFPGKGTVSDLVVPQDAASPPSTPP